MSCHSSDCSCSSSSRPKKAALLPLLVLLAGSAFLLVSLLGKKSDEEAAATVSSSTVGKKSGTAEEDIAIAPSEAASDAAIPETIDLTEIHASEEFIHVPGWLPKPDKAIAASAVEATLLSNGIQEGTVNYTLAGTESEWRDWFGQMLTNAGLTQNAERFHFEDPPRHCELNISAPSSGTVSVSMKYHATDHEKGCKCTTCTGE